MTPDRKLNKKEEKSGKKGTAKEENDKELKDYIAVRWPSTLRQQLKVAAAGHTPPLTMTEYLAKCFNDIQDRGGFEQAKSASPRRSDREQRQRYQVNSEKLFKTRDRRLIECINLLLEYATR
jgi:hypothetical protein